MEKTSKSLTSPGLANQNPGEGLVLKTGSMKRETKASDYINPCRLTRGYVSDTKDDNDWINGSRPQLGLTKREYFAAMAMQGLISYPGKIGEGCIRQYEDVIRAAVAYADALIEELNKE